MSTWRFILIDREGVRTEVPQPINWTDPEVKVSREIQSGWHGVFFDYGVEKLEFTGLGFDLIKAEYEEYGVNGEMHLDIQYMCSQDSRYDNFYEHGRIAFDQYEDVCGDQCSVIVGIEDSSDIMLFRNNYEQKVNINSNEAFDQETELVDYDKLNFDLDVPARGIVTRSEAKSAEDRTIDFFSQFQGEWQHMQSSGNDTEEGAFYILFGPNDIINANEVGEGGANFSGEPYYFSGGDPGDALEIASISGNAGGQLQCRPGTFNIVVSADGIIQYAAFGDHTFRLRVSIKRGKDKDNTVTIAEQYGVDGFFNGSQTHPYSISINTNAAIEPGDRIWIYYYIVFVKSDLSGSAVLNSITHRQYVGTRIFMEATTVCEPTISKASMINETISRTVEAITNDKIRFYSTFFGRKDSEPYSVNNDTCAGLMAITNGLNVRRKLLKDGTQPGCFLTMKQLFDGLNPIWNIGLTIEPDPARAGFKRLRFEDWRFFYQNEVGLRFRYATKVRRKIDTNRLYNRMTVGYNKWEAGGTTGLDELMTKRTYRLNINAISKELMVTSDIVCSPYTIEITRRLDTTTEDWQYDNDLFGFCLKKVGTDYSIETFLDAAVSVQNVLDANTAYNGRITPARNAMRWFNYIIQGLRKLHADTRLIFSSGEGNYVAKLKMNACNIEGKVIAEDEDIDLTDFESVDNAKPITFPELVEFEHPLNYNLFKKIKDDPTLRYKAVAYYCNNTEYQGWLEDVSYRPEQGMAVITVIPKNDIQVPTVLPPENPCLAKILAGSVTFAPCGEGCMTVDFTEEVAGATFWTCLVTQGTVPAQGPGFSITTSVHPFNVTGLTPGDWSVFIVPYCAADVVGVNYGDGTFNIPAPAFELELSAVLTTGRDPNNKLQLTGTGNFASPTGFTFKFGQCCLNTSTGITACRAYPGSPVPPPSAQPGIMSFNTGQTSNMVESGYATPGANFGTITKIVLFDLQGITPSQIKKAAGQTWTLEFV